MSKTYILYWNLVYELCFSEDDIQREVYVSKMLFDFLMEYLQTNVVYLVLTLYYFATIHNLTLPLFTSKKLTDLTKTLVFFVTNYQWTSNTETIYNELMR